MILDSAIGYFFLNINKIIYLVQFKSRYFWLEQVFLVLVEHFTTKDKKPQISRFRHIREYYEHMFYLFVIILVRTHIRYHVRYVYRVSNLIKRLQILEKMAIMQQR